jgi:hypothetical protein
MFRLLLQPRCRYVLAWLLALALAGRFAYLAYIYFDEERRADGNAGHRAIDFGGQWLMGRMLVEGYARHLFDRNYQRAVLVRNFPVADQDPEAKQGDAADLMASFMGSDSAARPRILASFLTPLAAHDAMSTAALLGAGTTSWTDESVREVTTKRVGGPLYPPVNALFLYPLALIEPHVAYRIGQALNLLLAFVCGLAVTRLTGGWLWWPVASALILAYPGLAGSCNLGQNSTLSLTILFWGWVLVAGGREGWGGAVWGLLAYKPVWAVSFFFALALTRRWRACVAMLGTGTALAAATLPLVGIESWLDWLKVGRDAADFYKVSERWIWLSRDLLSIPRRWLIDFTIEPSAARDAGWLAPVLGWGLLGTVAALTAALALWRPKQARAVTGPRATFVLLGAWLCSFHFIYYDVLLSALPIFLLTADPVRYLLRVSVVRVSGPGPPESAAGHPLSFLVSNRAVGLSVVAVLVVIQAVVVSVQWGHAYGIPVDTFILLLVWLGCGWVWLRTPNPRKAEGSAPVNKAGEANAAALQPSP